MNAALALFLPTTVVVSGQNISGYVTYEPNGLPIPGATVALSGGTTASTTTDANGYYSFSGLSGAAVTITVTKLRTTNNAAQAAALGLTSADATRLNTPGTITGSDMIAGDLNLSGLITSQDRSLLQQVLLGTNATANSIYNTNGGACKFWPADYTMPANPLTAPYPTTKTITGVGTFTADFLCRIKGDIVSPFCTAP